MCADSRLHLCEDHHVLLDSQTKLRLTYHCVSQDNQLNLQMELSEEKEVGSAASDCSCGTAVHHTRWQHAPHKRACCSYTESCLGTAGSCVSYTKSCLGHTGSCLSTAVSCVCATESILSCWVMSHHLRSTGSWLSQHCESSFLVPTI